MSAEAREELRMAVALTGRALDEGRYDRFVGFFTADGEYRLEAKAPELREPMTWLALDRAGLEQLLSSVPQHEWPLGERTHLITVDAFDFAADAAGVTSTFVVLRTGGDGRMECYAAGRYDDLWVPVGMGWNLRRRVARLSNRLLTTPSPVPL